MTETLRRGYPGMKARTCETCPIADAAAVLLCRGRPAASQRSARSGCAALRPCQLGTRACVVAAGGATQVVTAEPCAQSVNDMPAVQDGPPPGGYPAIRFARRIPSTGPSGFTLFAVSAAVMAYGFYKARSPAGHLWGALAA